MKTTRIQIISSCIALFPGLITIWNLILRAISANPIQTATVKTGHTAIYLLIISLFCTPLFNIFKLSMFFHIRKTTGVFAFLYSLVHFLIFSVIDYELNLSWILPEITQKLFLQIGLAALVLLFLLAITSFQAFKKSLGIWWNRIHKLVYLITAAIIIHITLASKGDIIGPIIFGGLFFLAMVLRMYPFKNISIQKLPNWARDLNTYLIQSFP